MSVRWRIPASVEAGRSPRPTHSCELPAVLALDMGRKAGRGQLRTRVQLYIYLCRQNHAGFPIVPMTILAARATTTVIVAVQGQAGHGCFPLCTKEFPSPPCYSNTRNLLSDILSDTVPISAWAGKGGLKQSSMVRPIVAVAQIPLGGVKVAHFVPRRGSSFLDLRAAGDRMPCFRLDSASTCSS